jgi:histidinol-phosphate aminotransferase
MHEQEKLAYSRRSFAQLLGVGLAGLAIEPAIAEPALRKMAQAAAAAPATGARPLAAGEVVRLSANENPAGPSPMAFDAMREAFSAAWRYPDEAIDLLAADLAKLHGVTPSQVLVADGSSEILKVAAAAYAGAGSTLVMAEPTFEPLGHHARIGGASVVSVPLTSDFRHDVERMLAPARKAGLVYVCNPNNPTASITPKDDLRAFLGQLPPPTVALVDEAYFHYAESADYESVIPLVARHSNLIVARTFSKIYGMAGLRCGYAIGQAEAITALRRQQVFDSVNVLAVAAARASLRDTDHVVQGRRRNREVRSTVVRELDRLGFATIPSSANFIMVDVRRPVGPVVAALGALRIEVGRVFPALPHHLRVTIGTAEQMDAFLAGFRKVMS